MARVPYLSEPDQTSESTDVWRRLRTERKRPTDHIFRLQANAPAMLDAALSFANALRDRTLLDPRLRELAILVVGHATGSEYAVAHHQAHALKAGVTPEQLRDVGNFDASDAFNATELAVMRVARASTLNIEVSDELWAQLTAHLSHQEAVELSYQIAWYNGAVRIMAMLAIELEDDYRQDPATANVLGGSQ